MCYGACTQCGQCRGEVREFKENYCFYCNTQNREGAKVCESCGKRLLPPLKRTEPGARGADG